MTSSRKTGPQDPKTKGHPRRWAARNRRRPPARPKGTEWVQANFTNAAEILSVGYPAWVDALILRIR